MGTTGFVYDANKLEQLLLHVAEESVGDPKFGKTKLNKILFYIDFFAYGRFGQPVTGAEYLRRPYGPVPRQVVAARNALLARGDAVIEPADWFGLPQERLVAKGKADLSVFSQAEKSFIDFVIKALWDENGSQVSDISHHEPGWKIADDGEVIPYQAVFLSSRELTADDIRRGQEVYRILAAEAV